MPPVSTPSSASAAPASPIAASAAWRGAPATAAAWRASRAASASPGTDVAAGGAGQSGAGAPLASAPPAGPRRPVPSRPPPSVAQAGAPAWRRPPRPGRAGSPPAPGRCRAPAPWRNRRPAPPAAPRGPPCRSPVGPRPARRGSARRSPSRPRRRTRRRRSRARSSRKPTRFSMNSAASTVPPRQIAGPGAPRRSSSIRCSRSASPRCRLASRPARDARGRDRGDPALGGVRQCRRTVAGRQLRQPGGGHIVPRGGQGERARRRVRVGARPPRGASARRARSGSSCGRFSWIGCVGSVRLARKGYFVLIPRRGH